MGAAAEKTADPGLAATHACPPPREEQWSSGRVTIYDPCTCRSYAAAEAPGGGRDVEPLILAGYSLAVLANDPNLGSRQDRLDALAVWDSAVEAIREAQA